jgi:histidine decarboxylase
VPVVVVASVGTTMTEAVDDVRRIHAALAAAGVRSEALWVHADAALAGIPLALVDPATRPGFDIADGASSIVVSGHKFPGAPVPCAVLVVRDSARPVAQDRLVTYTGTFDATVSGSRNGHAALMLWWALHTWGVDGLRRRAEDARALAAHTVRRLHGIGWPAWRHDHAFTVVLDRPPRTVLDRWPLAVDGDRAHLVCMPGKTAEMVEQFVTDLDRAAGPVAAAECAPGALTRAGATAGDGAAS